ncbi:Cysteine--tRNA ligase [Jannaschia seosinensis]|uniref:Cysteine--tRNA ligase n=1 Tax=Jannaschia seosinensis TaxID=313367 RepID=A0A0M7BG13_9RHOB|nr:Cysteine--tRNA ligase [Jannaschia seosinensis]
MTIRLRNSMTRRVEDVVFRDPGRASLYLCGPTVYDRAHLGNARPTIVFDVLFRLLRHDLGPENVTYVRNFTDVDDKIIARAQETGRPIDAITAETTEWYLEDMAALGTLEPTHMPRATDHIADMVLMIETLIDRGHAYAAEGHVLFSVTSFPEYGALSGRSTEDMIAGARVEVAPYKRDPMDFVLWKPSAEGEPGWESPWSWGRPGWHIECSVMSKALLGPAFDIHGGGNDLLFPHHENEIAQSCCADPGAGFARYWLHNEMLLVEGKKMSKSLGNFFTVRDLLDRGVPGEVIRFVFLSTHYSKPMDWTEEKAQEAERVLRRWRGMAEEGGAPDPEVLDALRDDLNTPGAITHLHRLAKAGDGAALAASARLMGLLSPALGGWAEAGDADTVVEAVLSARRAARAEKDWARADALRDALLAAGVIVTDGKGRGWEPGPGFDPARLEELA